MPQNRSCIYLSISRQITPYIRKLHTNIRAFFHVVPFTLFYSFELQKLATSLAQHEASTDGTRYRLNASFVQTEYLLFWLWSCINTMRDASRELNSRTLLRPLIYLLDPRHVYTCSPLRILAIIIFFIIDKQWLTKYRRLQNV